MKFSRTSFQEHTEVLNDTSGRQANRCNAFRGSVLIFVTGISCISRIDVYLKKHKHDSQLKIIPLHAEIPMEQQCLVFDAPRNGERKVIISTNIAESSITVPDVKYVIDLCRTKSLFCDKDTNYTMLRKEWACKSSMDQRKGRAGKNVFFCCYLMFKVV